MELEGDFWVGEVVTPNYTLAQVLTVEGEDVPEVAAGDTGGDVDLNKPETTSPGMYNPNVCWRCGQVGHFASDCPNQDPHPRKALGRLHHTLEAENPISRTLLNEFFNKLMHPERRQEIAKAKLKKAWQQLSVPASPNQNQTGGNPPQKLLIPPAPTPTPPPAGTPPPANIPRKAQVGRPAWAAKAKTPLSAPAAGSKKAALQKPPVTRARAKNAPTPVGVAAADPDSNTVAPVDAEYDTDELAELPTDSESEMVESEPGEENAPVEEQ